MADNRMFAGAKHRRLLMVAIIVASLVMTAAVALALVEDFVDRDVLLPGANVAGVDVGGYRTPVAMALVARDVAMPLLKPLVVQYGSQRWTLATDKLAAVDTIGMVREAFVGAYRSQPLLVRVYHRAAANPVPVKVGLRFRYRDNRVQVFVRALQAGIDRPAIDAAMLVVGKRIVITPSQTARELKLGTTRSLIRDALPKGVRLIAPRVVERQPKKTAATFGKAIIIIKSEHTLYLFDKDKPIKSYPIACGTPAHPTPSGDWHIVLKRFMPTWINPGSAWAAGMPQSIPPGYNNPLGTRALDLDASGIRIHGTANDSSVGTDASHGCMRMHMPDIEQLYGMVPTGTPVFIRDTSKQ